jgi:hypothetical protein
MTYLRPLLAFLTGALSGAAWGTHELISHHYATFQAMHPNANACFWNPTISWEMTPIWMGYKFDAKHILASAAQIGALGGGIVVGFGRKKRWQYLVDFGAFSAGYIISNLIAFK